MRLSQGLNLHTNGGTGFQPVPAQAEAYGYPKLPYDCDLVFLMRFFGRRFPQNDRGEDFCRGITVHPAGNLSLSFIWGRAQVSAHRRAH